MPADRRVKLSPTVLNELGTNFGLSQRFPIWAVCHQRIHGIGEGDDSRGQWDLLSSKTVWIASSIPMFVVMTNRRHYVFEVRECGYQLGASRRVGLHYLPLFVSQLTFLTKDRRIDFVDLSEIVQKRGDANSLDFSLAQADPTCDDGS